MRRKDFSKQLTAIIVLMVVLIVLVGALIVLTVLNKDKDVTASAPADSIASESVENEDKEEKEPSKPLEKEEAEESEEPSKAESTESSKEEEKKEETPVKPDPPKKPYKPVQPVYEQKIFDKRGASYEAREIIKNGYITNGNIAVRNRTFNEDLYITADAGSDSIVLQNVIIKGKLYISGASSVTLHDVSVPEVIVSTGKKNHDLVVSGATTVERLTCHTSCSVDSSDLADTFPGIKTVYMSNKTNYLWLDLQLFNQDVENIFIEGASNIFPDRDSTVGTVTAAARCYLGGSGQIRKLNSYVDDVTFSNEPLEINVSEYADYPQFSKKPIGIDY